MRMWGEKIIMGWSIGFDDNWNRDIGYGVPAFCDAPGCSKKIHRGISHVCGAAPYGGSKGCGLYFCNDHLYFHLFKDMEIADVCYRCHHHKSSYKPKPDHPEWIKFKLTDPSWLAWRKARGIENDSGNLEPDYLPGYDEDAL